MDKEELIQTFLNGETRVNLTHEQAMQAWLDKKPLQYMSKLLDKWRAIEHTSDLIALLNDNCQIRLKSPTIQIGDVDVPEPVREELEYGTEYWHVNLSYSGYATCYHWLKHPFDYARLSNGVIHLTKEAAQQHADVLIKLNNQKPN